MLLDQQSLEEIRGIPNYTLFIKIHPSLYESNHQQCTQFDKAGQYLQSFEQLFSAHHQHCQQQPTTQTFYFYNSSGQNPNFKHSED